MRQYSKKSYSNQFSVSDKDKHLRKYPLGTDITAIQCKTKRLKQNNSSQLSLFKFNQVLLFHKING